MIERRAGGLPTVSVRDGSPFLRPWSHPEGGDGVRFPVASLDNPDVRVILVGRTGLDAALRLDSGVELHRVATPLEAIGELASPMDAQSPLKAVVVVSADVERSLREQAGMNGAGRERVSEFVRGLRLADPGVVVLGVGPSQEQSVFDDTIEPELSSEQVRRAVRATPGAKTAQLEPRAVAAPAAVSSSGIERGAPEKPFDPWPEDPTTDFALVTLLVKGQDLLPTAMALISSRTGVAAEFLAHSTNAANPGLRPTDQPVTWDGALLGHLRAPGVSAEALAGHAQWLAAWLRARDQQAQLKAAAFTDPLTGAYNRRYFDRFLTTALDQARMARRHVTVMVFDIDDFKKYNDRYGHDAGDDILREAVKLMRSVIRPTDRVCRIGGDEFAVIFYEPTGPRQEGSRHPGSVFGIAQRFQEQVQCHRFPKLGDCAPGTLTISGGLATYPWDGTTPQQLLAKADQHALASKRQGKNAITFGPVAPEEEPPQA